MHEGLRTSACTCAIKTSLSSWGEEVFENSGELTTTHHRTTYDRDHKDIAGEKSHCNDFGSPLPLAAPCNEKQVDKQTDRSTMFFGGWGVSTLGLDQREYNQQANCFAVGRRWIV